MKYILRSTILLIFSFSFGAYAQTASQGAISYRGQKQLELAGEWEFYWDTLFETLSDSSDKNSTYIQNPMLWVDSGFSNTGMATYRLKILADKNYQYICAAIPETHGSYELYLNSILISNNGVVDSVPENCIPKWIPKLAIFPLDSGYNELVMQVANYHHSRGGTYRPILIGNPQTILDKRELQVSLDMFLIGCLTLIGVFFLGLHLYWQKDESLFYFSLCALVYGLRVSVYDLHLLNKVFTNLSWQVMLRVEYLTIYATLFFWTGLIKKLYPEDFNTKVYIVLSTLFIAMISIIALTHTIFFTTIHKYALAVVAMSITYSLYVFIMAYRNDRVKPVLAFLCMAAILFVPTLSMAFYFGLIPYFSYIENIGTLSVALSMSFVMAVRFTDAFKQAEILRKETLEQKMIIGKSLEDKELLLAEIHHRVKNNLQIINSLLLLQSKTIKDNKAIKAIQDSQYRIQSMALVHQKLYQSSENNLGVNVKGYFEELIKLILASLQEKRHITIEKQIDNLRLDLDTVINIGLITNELIVNCLKYAFGDLSVEPKIRIQIKLLGNFLELVVEDNGCGYDEEEVRKSNSFGLKLVSSLSQNLDAKPEITSSSKGTSIRILMKKFKTSVI
ncbi:sensor histidine kinase [Reichenbachiella agariperforans]|uniref:sensor histidine kinase n=1 Tax=Reichenbachiella agariperforans TaxID=156994 RepID=UPI001C0826A4|nr:histidine kinase dimerization/phosphoacceptor domain -containing protein [Reichenbachiella agariperforans]MBU2914579.1 hypothetical protein [Reichenbachiella agariperforans]